MAIRDNLKSGGSSKKLYDALQYSGLVTEDMTYNEMCEVLKAYFPELYALYMSSANEGGFAAYAGSQYAYYDHTCFDPTVIFEEEMTVLASTKYNGAYGNGAVISEKVDLTGYSKIVFDYECNIHATANDNFIGVFITPEKQAILHDIAVYKEDLLIGKTAATASGTKEIDVSSLSGEYYIGFSMQYTVSANIKVSNMYMTGAQQQGGSGSGGSGGVENGYNVTFIDENSEVVAIYSVRQGLAVDEPDYSVSSWQISDGINVTFPYTPTSDVIVYANQNPLNEDMLFEKYGIDKTVYKNVVLMKYYTESHLYFCNITSVDGNVASPQIHYNGDVKYTKVTTKTGETVNELMDIFMNNNLTLSTYTSTYSTVYKGSCVAYTNYQAVGYDCIANINTGELYS